MGSACSGGQSVASVEAGNGGPGGKNDKDQDKEQADPPPDSGNQEEPARNGEVQTEQAQPGPTSEQQESPATNEKANVDGDAENVDDEPANYKLVYFEGLRFRAEPIRLILRFADVPYEEQLVSFSEWPDMKEATPMGSLPIFYINDRVICQSNAIARFLAKKYGLAGKTNVEMAKADMLIDAMTDVMKELPPLMLEQDAGKKSDLWHQLKDDVVCPFLDRCIKMLAENNTGWFVGDQVTWADLAIAELMANLNDKVDGTLLDTYPAVHALITGVRSLPRIEEYITKRQDAGL